MSKLIIKLQHFRFLKFVFYDCNLFYFEISDTLPQLSYASVLLLELVFKYLTHLTSVQYSGLICQALSINGDVLLAYEMNGEAIPPDHGFPVWNFSFIVNVFYCFE